MNTLFRLLSLVALTVTVLGADVKFSALPTATSPSTNSYLPIIDLNLLPASQNQKYLLTNLAQATPAGITNALGISTTPTELQYVSGATSAIQGQLNVRPVSSGASSVGNFPVYTDTTGQALTPTNTLAYLNVFDLVVGSMSITRTAISMTGTNLVVDFGIANRYTSCTLTGTVVNVIFTNVSAGKWYNVLLTMPGSNVTPTFPFTGTATNWFGGSPSTFTASTIGSLSFYPRDTATNTVLAAYTETQ